MIPWKMLDSVPLPGSHERLHLYQRGEEFSLRVENHELMNSRAHGSEDALAELACRRIAERPRARVLIGGLGLGFTLAAALARLGADAEAVVAELVPAVVAWNRGPLAAIAGHPLDDRRVAVREIDVAILLQTEQERFDAIMLDVDNGPDGPIREDNAWLYTKAGLATILGALRPAGVLAVWSAGPDRTFTPRLRRGGFEVDEVTVPARGRRSGGRPYTIWLAQRGR